MALKIIGRKNMHSGLGKERPYLLNKPLVVKYLEKNVKISG